MTPATGAVQDLGRSRYRPTQAIRDIVAAHDRECIAPGCHRTATACAYDHLTSHARGGNTSVANGNPACDHHNLLKEEPGWDIDKDADQVAIITPTGRRYTQPRHTILKPEPPPPEKPQPPPKPKPEPLPDEPPF